MKLVTMKHISAMSYSNITYFRYYPANSETHFTAMDTGTHIRQLKPSPQQSFDTLAEWVATLPGQPSDSELEISESYALENVDPDWNVPTWNGFRSHPCQMLWPAYLYLVLRKCRSFSSRAERTTSRNPTCSIKSYNSLYAS